MTETHEKANLAIDLLLQARSICMLTGFALADMPPIRNEEAREKIEPLSGSTACLLSLVLGALDLLDDVDRDLRRAH
jgi:hypothetical protein